MLDLAVRRCIHDQVQYLNGLQKKPMVSPRSSIHPALALAKPRLSPERLQSLAYRTDVVTVVWRNEPRGVHGNGRNRNRFPDTFLLNIEQHCQSANWHQHVYNIRNDAQGHFCLEKKLRIAKSYVLNLDEDGKPQKVLLTQLKWDGLRSAPLGKRGRTFVIIETSGTDKELPGDGNTLIATRE